MQLENEPVAWRTFDGEGGYDYRDYDMNENYDKEWAERNPNHANWVEPLYTSPPAGARTEDGCSAASKPLTVDEVWQNDQLMSLNAQLGCSLDLLMEVAQAIEAAHGIGEKK